MIKKMFLAVMALCVFSVFCLKEQASAEIYLGIEPWSTMTDLKERFPRASIEDLKPAWSTDTETLYRITGSGISGTLLIKMINIKPGLVYFEKENKQESQFSSEKVDPEEENKSTIEDVPEENLTFVDWVRWVPDLPLPITKVVAKYGKYSKSGTSDDFTPYKAWVGRGITAIVSEDGKYVHYLDFEFTQKENDEGYKKRFGSYPNQKEEKKSPKKSQSKDKRMGI